MSSSSSTSIYFIKVIEKQKKKRIETQIIVKDGNNCCNCLIAEVDCIITERENWSNLLLQQNGSKQFFVTKNKNYI